MNIVYFISEKDLKEYTPINLNVETQLIRTAIADAQILKMQQNLSTTLYKKICDLIRTDQIKLVANEKYKLLLDDYICPATMAWSLVEAIPYIRYKIMNKGVQTQDGENSSSIPFEETKYLISSLRNKAEFMSERLIKFITNNITDYPEYNQCDTDVKPSSTGYFGGIQFD